MIVQLERFGYTPFGTFGRLQVGPNVELYTVEPQWRDNRPNISCIPPGLYRLKKSRYNRGGYDAYELLEVPGRSLIKIHVGNTEDDLAGCIAPGLGLGWVEGKWAVTRSREAFSDFMEVLDTTQPPHSIRIIDRVTPHALMTAA